MNKYVKTLVDKPVCQITFDDIIELQGALQDFIKLENKLRKNATREKAKLLEKYMRKYYIPKKSWKDVHYCLDFDIKQAKLYREYLETLPTGR